MSFDIATHDAGNFQKAKEGQKLCYIKRAYFNLVYLLIKEKSENFLVTLILILFQFLQLMSFPFSPAFKDLWKTNKYSVLSASMYNFQIVSLLKGKDALYFLFYAAGCLYAIFLLIFILYLSIKVTNLQLYSKTPLKILNSLFNINEILFLPLVNLFLSIYVSGNNDKYFTQIFDYGSALHIGFCVFGGVCFAMYLLTTIVIELTNYEYRHLEHIYTSKITSITSFELLYAKLFFVVWFEFFSSIAALNIIATCLISSFLLYHFISYHPYYNPIVNKFYFTMYLIFFWTNFVMLLSVALKEVTEERNIPLIILGYAIIILNSFFGVTEFGINDFLGKEEKVNNPLSMLKKIKYFVFLVDCLNNKTYRRENVFLFGYLKIIENLLESSDDKSLTVLLKETQYEELSEVEQINCQNLLYHHAHVMYKKAIKKFPTNIMLRISYSDFLFEKIHHKHKCMDEINILEQFDLNFEESFLVFRFKKIISEQIDIEHEVANGLDFVSALAFKRNVNAFKSCIVKVSKCYVEFWSLLYESDQDNHQENFEKMSNLGNEIENLIEKIQLSFQKIESSNINDPEIIKMYSEFLLDILHDSESAKIYEDKLAALEIQQHKFDENNIYHLNYKILSQNEEYKYIIVSSQPENFGTIVNVSLSICSLFGYQKEDLVGKNLNVLIPDVCALRHDIVLNQKLKEFLKTPAFQKAKRSNFKEYKIFGKNKAKYLVPCVIKSGVVLSEEGDIFFVAHFLTVINQNQESEENCHVLTDKNLHIQNFTSNSLKFLEINSSYISSGIELTNFIEEFNEDLLNLEINYSGNFQLMIQKVKRKLLVQNYTTPKEITWSLPEVPREGLRSSSKYRSIRMIHGNESIISSPPSKPKKEGESTRLSLISTRKISGNSLIKKEGSPITKKEKKLFLEVKRLTIGGIQVGYLFQFTPSSVYLQRHRAQAFETLIKEISSSSNFEKSEAYRPSLIFGSIFQQIANKKKDPFSKYRKKKISNDLLESSSSTPSLVRFSLDYDKLSFEPNMINGQQILREKLQQLAYEKLRPLTEEKKTEEEVESKEETSEEYEDSEYTSSYYYSEDPHQSLLLENKNSRSNTEDSKNITEKSENYYKVNLDNITFFKYNFQKGAVEREKLTDLSYVDIILKKNKNFIVQEMQEKAKEEEKNEDAITQENEELLKVVKEKPNKKDKIELKLPEVTEKEVIINEIKVQLNNKDIEPTVLKLSFMTIFIFVSVTAIIFLLLRIIFDVKTRIQKNFSLIFQTFELNQNLLFSIHMAREVTFLKIDKYNNIFIGNRSLYVRHLENQMIAYFQRNLVLLEEFSVILSTINEKERKSIQNRKLNLTTKSGSNTVKYYTLPLLSALIENNMALYHLWEIGYSKQTLDDPNVFYFIYNSLNEIMIGSREEADVLLKEFKNIIEDLTEVFIIFILCVFAFFFITFFIFLCCYQKVELKKQSYLSVFYEIGGNLIVSCLAKCEVFSHKIQAELREDNESEFSEEIEEEEISRMLHMKQKTKKDFKHKSHKRTQINHTRSLCKFFIFLGFLTFYLCITSLAFLKVIFLKRYKHIADFLDHRFSEQTLYLLLLVIVREEIYEQNTSLMGTPVKEYTKQMMKEFYTKSKKEFTLSMKYFSYMPPKYQKLFQDVIYNDVCHYMDDYFEWTGTHCNDFLYNSLKYGLKEVYTTFVEDLRRLHSNFLKIEKNLSKKGMSFNDKTIKYYDTFYSSGDKKDIWNKEGPINLLNTELHKNLVIVMDVLLRTLFTKISNQMKNIVLEYQVNNHNLVVYLIYGFLAVECLIFLFLVVPFEVKLNRTIFKAKNMLSIIPLEILANLNQVKKMLYISEKHRMKKSEEEMCLGE